MSPHVERSAPRTLPSGGCIRPATANDLPDILRLNDEWKHVTCPLDDAALFALHEVAAYHRVCETDAGVVAFLLAIAPGAGYESPNYRGFESNCSEFLYIDRVVVSANAQRSGLGEHLYRDVAEYARSQGMKRLVCEVDDEPRNDASHAFHARHGFAEIGTQWLPGGGKRVSLMELLVGPEAAGGHVRAESPAEG